MAEQRPLRTSSAYIPEIDGLRAIAVLAVMTYHASASALPGGFVGVDVFFVISGYVVSKSLARDRHSATFRGFTVAFYARRILRIFPALAACLVLVTIATTLLVPSSWASRSNELTGLYAFFGASNFALLIHNDGYFSPRIEFNPFSHTWSLGVEEQFYVLFPLIFFAWLEFRQRPDLSGRIARAALPVFLVASLGLSAWESNVHPERAFYLIFSRFWELAAGALLFQLHETGVVRPASTRAAPWLLAIGLFFVSISLLFSDESRFPFPWALSSVLGSGLVIAAVVGGPFEGSILHRALRHPALVYVGKISYSLYLWHWPVYVVLRWTIGLETPLQITAAVAATFGLSILSYRLVETRVRRSRRILGLSAPTIVVAGLLIVFASFSASYWVFDHQRKLTLSVTGDKAVWYPTHKYRGPIDEGADQVLAGRTLWTLGDSHAGAYSTMLAELEAVDGLDSRLRGQGGCPAAGLVSPTPESSPCAEWLEDVVSEIEREGTADDIIFLSSLRVDHISTQTGGFDAASVEEKRNDPELRAAREASMADARRLLERLTAVSPNVILEAPKPLFRAPPFRCSDGFNANNPICRPGFEISRAEIELHRAHTMELIGILGDEFETLRVWDPVPILCSEDLCSAYDGTLPLFFDGDHLSGHGNRVLYPAFADLLESIWLPSADGAPERPARPDRRLVGRSKHPEDA